jgi:hypothetical protein
MMRDTSTGRGAAALAVVLAMASFAIYAAAALLVYQDRPSQHYIERYCLAAAVSSAVYGAPVGAIYSGVLAALIDDTKAPIEARLAALARGDTPRGQLEPANHDGQGIGYNAAATVFVWLFGVRFEALEYGFLSLVGLSTLAFSLRYRDARLCLAPLAFLALTIMLFTPLSRDQTILDQAPFAGVRYFSLAAILPTLHLLLELADPRQPSRRGYGANLALAAIQLFVLFVAILVRGSPAYNLIGLVVTCLFLFFHRRRDGAAVLRLAFKAGSLLLIGATMASMIYLWIPASYKDSGRIGGVVWHRALISLQVNPAWPFGRLSATYRCEQYLPQGLAGVSGDQIGHCFWIAYAIEHGLSSGRLVDEVYDGKYESVMRSDLIAIFRKYPKEVLATFLIYKPLLTLAAIKTASAISIGGISYWLILFPISESVIVLLFWKAVAAHGARSIIGALAAPAAVLTILAFLPPFVAWGAIYTVWDNVFYLFFDAAILIGALLFLMKPSRLRRGYDAVLRIAGMGAS